MRGTEHRIPISCVVVGYEGTLTGSDSLSDPELCMQPVSAEAVAALRSLRDAGLRLVLASNTKPDQDCRLALRAAGVEDLFSVVLQSAHIGPAKPSLTFYALAIAAAQCPAAQIVWVGDDLRTNALGPIAYGMLAVLLRPFGPEDGEILPFGAQATPNIQSAADLIISNAKWFSL